MVICKLKERGNKSFRKNKENLRGSITANYECGELLGKRQMKEYVEMDRKNLMDSL